MQPKRRSCEINRGKNRKEEPSASKQRVLLSVNVAFRPMIRRKTFEKRECFIFEKLFPNGAALFLQAKKESICYLQIQ